MGKLTNIEKHFILTSGKDIDAIAKELGRPKATVKKYYDENHKDENVEENIEPPKPLVNPAENKNPDVVNFKTGLGHKKGATIMTNIGSEKGDLVKRNKNKNESNKIHRLK